MQIDIDKGLVKCTPESAEEKAKLEQLWKLLIDCNGAAKKMSPVGEYVPSKGENTATFFIEGLPAGTNIYMPIIAQEDCQVICRTCNRIETIKKGEAIPICCGKIMEIVD